VNPDEADYLKLGSRLVMAGSSAVLRSLGILGINAAGFTSSGVAAGSLAATIQSIAYGPSTGGLFSIFQSMGATSVVAPPLALAGAAVAGVGIAMLSICGGHSKAGESGSSDGNPREDGSDGDNTEEGRSCDGHPREGRSSSGDAGEGGSNTGEGESSGGNDSDDSDSDDSSNTITPAGTCLTKTVIGHQNQRLRRRVIH